MSPTNNYLDRLTKGAENKTSAFSLNDPGTNNRVLINPTRVCQKIRVDGNLTEIKPERCDWCIRDPRRGECLFVELKGHHWTDAVKQIGYTICWFNQHITPFSVFKECYVIMRSSIPSNSTAIQQAKIRFARKYKSQLQMRHPGITIDF